MKPRYKLDKRQKELARKQKQDRKKVEKLVRKDQPDSAGGEGDAPAVPDGETDPAPAERDDNDPLPTLRDDNEATSPDTDEVPPTD